MTAPREMAGRVSKCPACGNPVYVPTPEEEIEELPLAPEDVSDLQKEAMLQAERRRLDSLLLRENDGRDSGETSEPAGRTAVPPGAGSQPGAGQTGGVGSIGSRLEKALHTYLVAVRDSNLDAAERALNILRMQPRTARELVDRLATDQIPPPEMAKVPATVYQGFLKSLRSRLQP